MQQKINNRATLRANGQFPPWDAAAGDHDRSVTPVQDDYLQMHLREDIRYYYQLAKHVRIFSIFQPIVLVQFTKKVRRAALLSFLSSYPSFANPQLNGSLKETALGKPCPGR